MTRKEFNLARERRKHNLTQVQLAELAGYTPRWVQHQEANGITCQRVITHYKNIFKNISK